MTLDPEAFKVWTAPFAEGSYYKGRWEEGETVRFLVDGENGKPSGILSKIVEKRAPEFTSIKHIGVVADGVDDSTSDNVKKWAPSFENYTLIEKDGGTEFIVDIDVAEEFQTEEFQQMCAKTSSNALQKLKELCESK